MTILAQLASDDVLGSAYEWFCRRRRDYSANADVWAFRRNWPREKEQIKQELHAGTYRFSLLSRVMLKDGEVPGTIGLCRHPRSNSHEL